jgi:hypothetical protein
MSKTLPPSMIRNRAENGRYQKPTKLEEMHISMMIAYYSNGVPWWVTSRKEVRQDVCSLADCTFKLSRECEPVSVESIEIITTAVCSGFQISE